MIKGKKLKALEKLVSGDFETYEGLADELKITSATLRNWRNEEEFAAELERRMRIKIGGIAARALKRMNELIDEDGNVAFSAAKDILDRAGYKATDKVAVEGDVKTSGNMSVSFEGVLDEWSE